MTTVSVSRLKGLLDKARHTGICEESFTVSGMDITVGSLTPDDYSEVFKGLDGLDGVEYLHTQQVEQIARSIREIDGTDFRNVDFIETEAPGTSKKVKVPKAEWLRDNLVSSWSRETVYVVFRKVLDAVGEAERVAHEGVTFRLESETSEEKFRRLLGEALAAGADIPTDMREVILKENDLLEATSEEDLKAANEEAKRFLAEQREIQAKPSATPVEESPALDEGDEIVPYEPIPVRAPQQLVEAAEEAIGPSPEELMRQRTPLNREPVRAQVPQEAQIQVANRRPPPPPASQVVSSLSPRSAERAAQYAALENEASLGGVPLGETGDQVYSLTPSTSILERRAEGVSKEVYSVIDKGPVAGRNKNFVDTRGLDPRRRR